ncbi:MAG: hypothetical protein LQ352_003783 [Teloschistes flavicans]|nr:MAG: hypothetical protein LQ352_003783 [Teloschistes flavicans]
MAVSESISPGMIDPAIFEQLQANIDSDAQVREELRNILQRLERQGIIFYLPRLTEGDFSSIAGRTTQSLLSRAHSVPAAELHEALTAAWPSISEQGAIIKELESVASKHPYYKYNQIWTRDMQETIMAVVFFVWLVGAGEKPQGSLPTIEEVGSLLDVPINVKDRDTFHITTEEYLHVLISLIEELVGRLLTLEKLVLKFTQARLAVNSVTLGDYERPLQISKFVKDVYAGFQILNLKNDALRRRSDGIKYNVKKIEDVKCLPRTKTQAN